MMSASEGIGPCPCVDPNAAAHRMTRLSSIFLYHRSLPAGRRHYSTTDHTQQRKTPDPDGLGCRKVGERRGRRVCAPRLRQRKSEADAQTTREKKRCRAEKIAAPCVGDPKRSQRKFEGSEEGRSGAWESGQGERGFAVRASASSRARVHVQHRRTKRQKGRIKTSLAAESISTTTTTTLRQTDRKVRRNERESRRTSTGNGITSELVMLGIWSLSIDTHSTK